MTLEGLDELDRHILGELQRDARRASSRDIAAKVSASPSTVRKRLQRLEDEGIVTAYRADVDYDRAGYDLHVQVVCTARIPEREAMADAGLEIPGVVGVRELATGERNVVFTVVSTDRNDLTRIAAALSEIGLTIVDEELIPKERVKPFFESTLDQHGHRERGD